MVIFMWFGMRRKVALDAGIVLILVLIIVLRFIENDLNSL